MSGSQPQCFGVNVADRKSREVRLGLVMYGGVSLAVYINGVAHEFFRAVRGRGIYRWIKALTDSDIVVDVVSGTSAGGINGIFLSYALCNAVEFRTTAQLWREHGGIRELLRSPRSAGSKVRSVLDSEGYYQPHLEEAFKAMDDDRCPCDAAEDVSELKELDLFVTGTDARGRIYTRFDDAGHAIDIKDHRAVFILEHRAGRKEPFRCGQADRTQATRRALAKLARITSTFPVAFAPVAVFDPDGCDAAADDLLKLWGQLDGQPCFFLDGGILDNKPFTHTLNAIFYRVADRRVDRKLFYIEPDPESFDQRKRTAKPPNIAEVVLASLIGIPGYESIAEDLKLLAAHNTRLEQYERLASQLRDSTAASPQHGAGPPAHGRLYLNCRLAQLSKRVVDGIFRKQGVREYIAGDRDRNTAAQFIHCFDRLMAEMQEEPVGELLCDFDVYYRLRRLFRVTYLIYDLLYGEHCETGPPGEELGGKYRLLLYVLNRQIKLYEILQSAMEELIDKAPIDWRKIAAASEQKGEAQAGWVTGIWMLVDAAYRELLEAGGELAAVLPAAFDGAAEWLPQHLLSQVNRELRECRIGRICSRVKKWSENLAETAQGQGQGQPAAAAFGSVLRRLDELEESVLAWFALPANDPVQRAYRGFDGYDGQMFPMEFMADFHEKDSIEIVRISPRDATTGFSHRDYPDKVSGDALYHFAAFFKRSWRANDILWGRLDGACQLIETLFSAQRIEQVLDDPGTLAAVRKRFFSDPQNRTWNDAMKPEALFPNAGKRTHQELEKWLHDLLLAQPSDAREALAAGRFTDIMNRLIEAAQLEIIAGELEHVIGDALAEQVEWNSFQVEKDGGAEPKEAKGQLQEKKSAAEPVCSAVAAAGTDEAPWVLASVDGHLDPLVALTGAAEVARTSLTRWKADDPAADRPLETRLGKFFEGSYQVGKEKLTRDIPAFILLQTLAKALLVVRNCIVSLFEEKDIYIKRNAVYRYGLNLPLQLFYTATLLVGRRSKLGVCAALGIVLSAVVAVAALGVAVMHYPLIAFLAALAVLSLLCLVLWWKRLIGSRQDR